MFRDATGRAIIIGHSSERTQGILVLGLSMAVLADRTQPQVRLPQISSPNFKGCKLKSLREGGDRQGMQTSEVNCWVSREHTTAPARGSHSQHYPIIHAGICAWCGQRLLMLCIKRSLHLEFSVKSFSPLLFYLFSFTWQIVILRSHSHLLEWVLSKRQTIVTIGKDMEKRDPLSTIGWNRN